MKKYRVTVPFAVFVTVEVEAENKESAEEIGINEAYIGSYAGNGGSNKLIGVNGPDISIEANAECILEDPYEVEVEEVRDATTTTRRCNHRRCLYYQGKEKINEPYTPPPKSSTVCIDRYEQSQDYNQRPEGDQGK